MDQQFVWRILTEVDMDEAKKFVYRYYSKQLPLAKIFRVKDEEMGRRNMEQTEQMIKNGTSYGCFHKMSGKIVAILQCSVLVKDETQTKLKCEENCSPELSALSRFVDWMLKDIFTELNAKKVLMHSCGAVADEFKRNGLIRTVRNLTEELAQRLGCDYEIALIAKRHWERPTTKAYAPDRSHEIAFCDYVDPQTGMKPNLQLLPDYTHAMIIHKKVCPASPKLVTKL